MQLRNVNVANAVTHVAVYQLHKPLHFPLYFSVTRAVALAVLRMATLAVNASFLHSLRLPSHVALHFVLHLPLRSSLHLPLHSPVMHTFPVSLQCRFNRPFRFSAVTLDKAIVPHAPIHNLYIIYTYSRTHVIMLSHT